MLETNLLVLQLNIMKSGPRMEALINDRQSQNLDVLLIQEPSGALVKLRPSFVDNKQNKHVGQSQ
jgi:hypothetical protein